jgi:DNA repair exonuclease SbcCD nuclease subunit
MTIAITADLHLISRQEHPERYAALDDILLQMRQQGVATLIIAGDLFDASRNNYADFEQVCSEHPDIQFWIIPGNHDPSINHRTIVAPNARIYTAPEVNCVEPGSVPFFFLPYEKGKTIGERIAEFSPELPIQQWVLVAHGDYLESARDANPYEEGLYMPLTRKDLQMFRPRQVFLGHIHVPADKDPVYYTGSPCGLDITETGTRRFLLYDPQSGRVESRKVNTQVLFFNETLTVFPMDDESAYVQAKIADLLSRWALQPDQCDKVQLRITLNGFSSDREALLRVVQDSFPGMAFYKNEAPDLSAVSSSTDPNRDALARMVVQRIRDQAWPEGPDEPSRDEMILSALKIIYGGRNGSSH